MTDGRRPFGASPDLYHNCEKRIKRPRGPGRPCRRRAILCSNVIHIHADRSEFPSWRPVYNPRDGRNSMSDRKYRQRGYQDEDRDRTAAPCRAPAGARTGRSRRRTPNLSGRAQEHQHAGVSACRSLRAVRHTWRRRRSGSTAGARSAGPSCTRARSAPRSIQAADSNACNRSLNGSVPRARGMRARCMRPGRRLSGRRRRRETTMPEKHSTTFSISDVPGDLTP